VFEVMLPRGAEGVLSDAAAGRRGAG